MNFKKDYIAVYDKKRRANLYIDEAKSIQQIMDSITVVESNYGASYNYVMVRESTVGVNKSIQNKTYKSGSWFYDWGTSTDINLRDFKFERLIIKE